VLARPAYVAGDRIPVNADEPCRLAGADPLGHVGKDGHHLVGGQAGVEQGRALAFGEAGFASGTAKHAGLVGSVACGHREVAVATFAVVGAIGVKAAEAAEVVHDRTIRRRGIPIVRWNTLPCLSQSMQD